MIDIQPSLYMCMLQCLSQGDDCLPLLERIRHISKYINPKKLFVRGRVLIICILIAFKYFQSCF